MLRGLQRRADECRFSMFLQCLRNIRITTSIFLSNHEAEMCSFSSDSQTCSPSFGNAKTSPCWWLFYAFLVSTTIVNPEGRKERCISDMICDVFVRFGITRELNEPIAPVVRHVPAGFFPQEATLEETDRIVFETGHDKIETCHWYHDARASALLGAFANSSIFYCL